jgi:hypothetical protein
MSYPHHPQDPQSPSGSNQWSSQPDYGAASPPGYGDQQQPGYGQQQPSVYGQQQPPAYGQQQPGYGQQQPPAYGQEPPGYGQQQPPAYGQTSPAYGQSSPAYGQSSPGVYGQSPPGFGAPPQPPGRTSGGGGKRFAIVAAVILVVVVIGGIAAALVVSNLDDASRDESGEITEGGDVSAFSLAVGDCLNDLTETEVTSVAAIPCAEPHESEVYALFDLEDGAWPGDATIEEQAGTGCAERLQSDYPEVFDDTNVDIFYLQPTEQTWETGDREIVCLTFYLDGQRTGSLSD